MARFFVPECNDGSCFFSETIKTGKTYRNFTLSGHKKKKDRIYSDLQEQTRHCKDCQVSETISTTTATITETIL